MMVDSRATTGCPREMAAETSEDILIKPPPGASIAPFNNLKKTNKQKLGGNGLFKRLI